VAGRFLSATPLPQIGLISYALYLWHWPLLALAFIWTGGEPSTPLRILMVGAAFVLATLSYFLVERPIRGGRTRWQVVALVALMGGIGMMGYAVSLTGGIGSRVPERIQVVLDHRHYASRPEARAGVCWLDLTTEFERFGPQCRPRGNDMLIWGDSHAARLYPGIRAVVGGPIAQLTRNGCPAIDVPFGERYESCVVSNAKVLAEIRRTVPRTVVLFAAWLNHEPTWPPGSRRYASLVRTIVALKSAGIERIVLLGPAPRWTASLPDIVYRAWAKGPPAGPIPERLKDQLDPNAAVVDVNLRTLAADQAVTFFSVLGAMCNADGCLTHVPGDPTALVSWDGQHLTTPGAILVARKMKEAGVMD
jgi:hypothetical protein